MKTTLALAAVLSLATPEAFAAATVKPHRAVYDISLARSTGGASVSSAQGRLAFEVQGSSCEGWTVSFRMAVRYQPPEGEANVIDTQSTAFEAPDGTDFRYQMKEVVNGAVKEEKRLKMTRASVTAEGQGEMTTGDKTPFTVPANAWLPMQHQQKLMAIGEAGGGRDASIIFDGADIDKIFKAISFVGKVKPAGSIARDQSNPDAAALKGLQAWPMSISYYPESGNEEIPDYQVTFDMYENGVATGLVLDYGAFALTGKLANLQMLEASDCP